MKKFILIFLCFAIGGQAAEGGRHKILRRLLGGAACALSAWDFTQTAKHVGRNEIIEENRLLARANLGVMAGLKIGSCAAPIIIGELGANYHTNAITNTAIVLSAGMVGVNSFAVIHNVQVSTKH